MANEFKVNEQAPLGLNLRSEPDPTVNNIIAVIPFNHDVTKLADSEVDGWWRARTVLQGATATGFVNSRFLTPTEETGPLPEQEGVVAVHLPTAGINSTRQNLRRAHPLTENPPVKRRATDPPDLRVSAIRQLIDWLGVEMQSHARYQPGGGITFCNIYAYDYCFMTGAFLPRVWWDQQAIAKLVAGQTVPVKYGETVNELSANDINQWFKEWGDNFGWRRTVDLNDLQSAANRGLVCISVGRAKPQFHHGHGHIVATVPETDPFRALRQNGQVVKPVQSQAGAHNRDYVVQRWWDDGTYADFAHWIHD